MARGEAVDIFVDGADQDLTPEAVDGARRLPLFAQPVEHGDAVQILAAGTLAPQGQQSARDGQLVARVLRNLSRRNDPVKCRGAGSAPAAQSRDAAAGLDEVKLAIKANAVAHAQPRIKIQQVDATAQQDVLAVVDQDGRVVGWRERKRGSAAAQKRAGFKYLDAEPGAAQGGRGGKAGQSATDDDCARHFPS